MKKRLFYEAPETELFVVRFEDNFLGTGDEGRTLKFGSDGDAGSGSTVHEIEDSF